MVIISLIFLILVHLILTLKSQYSFRLSETVVFESSFELLQLLENLKWISINQKSNTLINKLLYRGTDKKV